MNKEDFYLKVKTFEGFRSKPYLCPSGYPTIGYGHRIKTMNFPQISRETASLYLRQDMESCLNQVGTLCIPLQEHEMYALADLVFNIGIVAFRKSSLPSLLQTYSVALDKKNFQFAEKVSQNIGNKLLEFCHYHDKMGVLRVSPGLRERCYFRRLVWFDKPLY